MRQEFYKTTLVSKFIKYLLSYSPLPLHKIISDNEDMIEGCIYTYKDKVLKCTKSGKFLGITGTSRRVDYLTAQEPLRSVDPFHHMFASEVVNPDEADNRYLTRAEYSKYTPEVASFEEGWMSIVHPDQRGEMFITDTIPLAVTDNVVSADVFTVAEFDIVDEFLPDGYKSGVTQAYVSNVGYYDPETHRWLGEYLRYLRNMYNLDLMPLYNCFSSITTQDFELDKTKVNHIVDKSSTRYKMLLVPIKYGKEYTIAIESELPVLMKAVLYNDGLIKGTGDTYLCDYINESVIVHNNMQFKSPITYSLSADQINSKSAKEAGINLHKYERYLYLAIQLPVANSSSIAVLEGDYVSSVANVVSDIQGLVGNSSDNTSKMMVSELSLLKRNDGIQHPFSDKLIQYLLRNTIDTREYIDDNVSNIEEMIGYYPQHRGQWDDALRYLLFNNYRDIKNHSELNYQDILGYVDSDIENAARKGYILNGK